MFASHILRLSCCEDFYFQVNPESLEDDAKSQMKNVKAAGHKDVRWCGAYKVPTLGSDGFALKLFREQNIFWGNSLSLCCWNVVGGA